MAQKLILITIFLFYFARKPNFLNCGMASRTLRRITRNIILCASFVSATFSGQLTIKKDKIHIPKRYSKVMWKNFDVALALQVNVWFLMTGLTLLQNYIHENDVEVCIADPLPIKNYLLMSFFIPTVIGTNIAKEYEKRRNNNQ